jgi:hypothetical protein
VAFDRELKECGYLAMNGQIVDATLVAAPKQRNLQAEKAAIKEGKSAAEIWPDQPAKAAQTDTDARWTLKFAKARPTPEGMLQSDIAIPSFDYKSSISIRRRFWFICKGKVTEGPRFDGRMIQDVVTNNNTASDVCPIGLSQSGQRKLAGPERQGQPDQLQEAEGQAHT